MINVGAGDGIGEDGHTDPLGPLLTRHLRIAGAFFEPDPGEFALLEKNVEGQPGPSSSIFPAGVCAMTYKARRPSTFVSLHR